MTRGDDARPLDTSRIVTTRVASLAHKVTTEAFARPVAPGGGADVLDSMPALLGADALRRLADRIVAARRNGRPVVFGFGGHLVKTGLAPLVVDLVERGLVTALATNGSGAIHDFEIAAVGHSSEDVGPGLADGSWGMARETADAVNAAARAGAEAGTGFGRALGRHVLDAHLPHAGKSLLACAAAHGIPATVHVAVGCDTIHMHPSADGAAIGAASLTDFRKLATVVSELSGGVYLNVGSAVILPEVFVKALNLARNVGHEVGGFTTANLDMLRHYRPRVNVLERPGGEAIEITGHHEINVPLLRWAVLRRLAEVEGAS